MKTSILKIVAAFAIGSATIALSASAAPVPTLDHAQASPMHRHGHRMHDPLLHAVQRLDLTQDQQNRIHALLDGAKQGHVAKGQHKDNLVALANPGDPNYPAAVQQSKTDAVNRIQARSDLDTQIYALLTTEQKAKLPQVIADMQAKMQQRHQSERGNNTASVS